MYVWALGHEKQIRAGVGVRGCALEPSVACPGLQWQGAAVGITLQVLGPNDRSLVKGHLSLFCYIADLISSCVSLLTSTFFFSLVKRTLLEEKPELEFGRLIRERSWECT